LIATSGEKVVDATPGMGAAAPAAAAGAAGLAVPLRRPPLSGCCRGFRRRQEAPLGHQSGPAARAAGERFTTADRPLATAIGQVASVWRDRHLDDVQLVSTCGMASVL
jgi:hypothetical protein